MNQSVGNCSYFNKQQPMYNAIRCSGSDCFAMWQLTDGRFELLNKGCWKNPERCESNLVRNVLFCCRKNEFCNRNMDAERCFDQTREIFGFFKSEFGFQSVQRDSQPVRSISIDLVLEDDVHLFTRAN